MEIIISQKLLRKAKVTRRQRYVLGYIFGLPISEQIRNKVQKVLSYHQRTLFMDAFDKIFQVLKKEKKAE